MELTRHRVHRDRLTARANNRSPTATLTNQNEEGTKTLPDFSVHKVEHRPAVPSTTFLLCTTELTAHIHRVLRVTLYLVRTPSLLPTEHDFYPHLKLFNALFTNGVSCARGRERHRETFRRRAVQFQPQCSERQHYGGPEARSGGRARGRSGGEEMARMAGRDSVQADCSGAEGRRYHWEKRGVREENVRGDQGAH